MTTALHPILTAAAGGRLPEWAVAGKKRVAHVHRVAILLGEWAAVLGHDELQRARWRATAVLHDALHDAPHDELRPLVRTELQDLPGKMLHGPACVVRLREEGVPDREILHAIEYHTMGHPDLTTLGRALYVADYLEPGRQQDPEGRAAMRARMPADLDGVLLTVLRERLIETVRQNRRVRPETFDFWNTVADEQQH